jgi:hypothetical protein
LDLDVKATTIFKGNWNAVDNGIRASESLGAQTLPDSLYLSSKPAWFGGLAWPPFDPQNPVQSYEAIPAGYRYVHRVDLSSPDLPNTNRTTVEQKSSAQFLPFVNVFNPPKESLQIKYQGAVDGSVMSVFDRKGNKIKVLAMDSGLAIWDGRNSQGAVVASGMYVLVLESNGSRQIKKVVVIK